jgi:hypothetical protein
VASRKDWATHSPSRRRSHLHRVRDSCRRSFEVEQQCSRNCPCCTCVSDWPTWLRGLESNTNADFTNRCVWSASFASTNNPLVYTYVAETATATMRAKTSGVALALVYASQIAWMYATPVMLNSPVVGLSNSGKTCWWSLSHYFSLQ